MIESVYPLVYPQAEEHRQALRAKRDKYQIQLEEIVYASDYENQAIPDEYREYANNTSARLSYAIAVLNALENSAEGKMTAADERSLPFWHKLDLVAQVFGVRTDVHPLLDEMLLQIREYTQDIQKLLSNTQEIQ